MSRFRKPLYAGVVVLSLALFAGCGGGSSSTEGTGSGNASPTSNGGSSGGATTSEAGGALKVNGVLIAKPKLWAAAKKEGKLVLYSSIATEREQVIDKQFEKQTGIHIDLVRIAGSDLYLRVKSEFAAKNLGADVIDESDIGLMDKLVDAGATKAYCPMYWKKLVSKLRGPQCKYFAREQSGFVIGYNTKLVKPADAPKTWKDLLDPKWKGKITLPYIGAGGSEWGRGLYLRKKYGVDYWKKLAAQDPFITQNASSTTDANAKGQGAVAMVLPGDQLLAKAQGAPLQVVFPSDGWPAYGHWAAMTSTAKHPAAAKVFLNWSTSSLGAKAITDVGDYPPRKDAPAPSVEGVKEPALSDLNVVHIDREPEFVAKRQAWQKEWLSIFGYTPAG